MPAESRRLIARLELPLILLIAWGAMMFVRPYGDFPLNDDENCAIATWNFARTGHFQFTISTTPPLRAQVVWGAVWTWLFGESFEVLRSSTMFLAALTLLVINRLLAAAGAGLGARLLGTVAFFFNPVFFWATHTFMTEVPYVFASAVAMYAFYRSLRDERMAWMVAGCIAVAVSWWIRQGVVNAVPPLVVLLAFRQRMSPRWRTFIVPPALMIVIFGLLWWLRRDWMVAQQSEFLYHWKMWAEPTFRTPQIASLVSWYFFYTVHSVTMTFVPVSIGLLFCIPLFRLPWQRLAAASLVVLFTFAAFYLVTHAAAWPFYPQTRCCEITAGNIITNLSLGPPTMSDVWSGKRLYPFSISFGTRAVATVLTAIIAAVAFAVLIVVVVTRIVPNPHHNLLILLCVAHAAAGTVLLLVSSQVFDRYSFGAAWSIGIVLPLIIPWSDVRVRGACIAALVIVALFSLMGVQEYFEWNRARWAAYWELRNRGVKTQKIDAGAEPVLYYETAFARDQHERRRLLFDAARRPYAITFGPMPGFRVIARHPWRARFGFRQSAVVTSERIAAQPAAAASGPAPAAAARP